MTVFCIEDVRGTFAITMQEESRVWGTEKGFCLLPPMGTMVMLWRLQTRAGPVGTGFCVVGTQWVFTAARC